MLRFVKSSLRRLLEHLRTGAQAPKGTASGGRAVRFAGLLEGTDHTDQLFGSVGNGDIVMFTLRNLLSEISSKCWIPLADELGCIEEGIPQIPRPSLFHMGISILQFAGLICVNAA